MAKVSTILGFLVLLLAGCVDPAGWDHPLPPIETLPWPAPEPALPCTPFAPRFELPAIAASTGQVRVANPMALLATGVVTTLDLVALDAGGAVDASAAGAVTLDLAGAGTVRSVSMMVAGRAEARVVLERAGALTATATLTGDGRVGRSELYGFATQLPVWALTIDPAQLALLTADPHADVEVPATLTVGAVGYATTVRLHGGTSRDFPKKSFRFDLGPGLALDGHDHLILRGEWNDKAVLRNWLGYEVFRRGTWLPTPAAELVHFRVNERFYGLMVHVERIDRDFLRPRGLDPEGGLYEADPPHGEAPGDLTPLPPAGYPVVYDQHAGTEAYADLRHLIEDVLRRPPGDFEATLPDELEVDDYLVYLAAMAVVQNHDHIRKNYYLYRDAAAGRGWVALPWDLDLSFGHMYTVEGDVLDEGITFDEDPYVGSTLSGGGGQFNQLIERVLAIPELRERMGALARRIAGVTATRGFVDGRLDSSICRAMPELLTDERKRATNAEYLGRVDEIRGFVDARPAVLEALP